MKPMNSDEFARKVLAYENLSEPFEPQIYYDESADCLEFIAKQDDFYAKRIDELITVYYSRKDNELMGSLIKGVVELVRENPQLKILVDDGKIKLAHIFIAHLAMSEKMGKIPEVIYRRLIKQAEDNKVEFACSV